MGNPQIHMGVDLRDIVDNFYLCVERYYPKASVEDQYYTPVNKDLFSSVPLMSQERDHIVKPLKVNVALLQLEKGKPYEGIRAWLFEHLGVWCNIPPKIGNPIYSPDSPIVEFPISIYYESIGTCCVCGYEELKSAGKEINFIVLGPPFMWYDIRSFGKRSDMCCLECKKHIESQGMDIEEYWHIFHKPIWDFLQYGTEFFDE